MSRFLSTRLVVALATGALTVAAGGAALAAGTGGGTIAACVHRHGGDLYRARHCGRGDTKLTWNIHGAQGAPGTPASAGLPATKLMGCGRRLDTKHRARQRSYRRVSCSRPGQL